MGQTSNHSKGRQNRRLEQQQLFSPSVCPYNLHIRISNLPTQSGFPNSTGGGRLATLADLGQASSGGHAGHGHDDDDDEDENEDGPKDDRESWFAGGERRYASLLTFHSLELKDISKWIVYTKPR